MPATQSTPHVIEVLHRSRKLMSRQVRGSVPMSSAPNPCHTRSEPAEEKKCRARGGLRFPGTRGTTHRTLTLSTFYPQVLHLSRNLGACLFFAFPVFSSPLFLSFLFSSPSFTSCLFSFRSQYFFATGGYLSPLLFSFRSHLFSASTTEVSSELPPTT